MINDDRLELECVPTRVARVLQLCVAVVCATATAAVYVALAACLLAAACLILCAILCEVLSAAWL